MDISVLWLEESQLPKGRKPRVNQGKQHWIHPAKLEAEALSVSPAPEPEPGLAQSERESHCTQRGEAPAMSLESPLLGQGHEAVLGTWGLFAGSCGLCVHGSWC